MIFSEKERQIYACPHTKRAYDPLATRRVLLAETKGRFGELCADKSETARGVLVAAARKAFGLPPIAPDGSGVLEAVVWDTLVDFTRWLSGKGPRVQTPPNSVPSTASPAPSTTNCSSP